MNIFILHHDPREAARMMCDKHVIKMLVEGCQMLSTNHRIGGSHVIPPVNLYKQSFQNHPCTIWARETTGNYFWLADHTHELSLEYTRRYNKIHKAHDMTVWFALYHPQNIPRADLTPYAQAMPDEYKVPGDGVAAYRRYYLGAKSKFAKWKYTKIPDWYAEGLTNAAVMV